MDIEEMGIKFYIYQLVLVFFIWIGMTIFIDKLYDQGKIIYYGVTSWLLFLIVLTIKKYLRDRRAKETE